MLSYFSKMEKNLPNLKPLKVHKGWASCQVHSEGVQNFQNMSRHKIYFFGLKVLIL